MRLSRFGDSVASVTLQLESSIPTPWGFYHKCAAVARMDNGHTIEVSHMHPEPDTCIDDAIDRLSRRIGLALENRRSISSNRLTPRSGAGAYGRRQRYRMQSSEPVPAVASGGA